MPILTDQERIGTLLGERYRIDAILGRGGMGVVFRASTDDGQRVAVKILRAELAQSDPQFAKRFLREARAAAAIRHPNVVEVLDLGEEPDGTIYQVLELLEGGSLRDHLQRKEKLDLSTTLELLLPVMNALEAAHAQGIVHRDLKPDNIYLARQPSGEVKPTLLDFGIAKLLDTRGGSFATNTGSIMGTPAYMAPEQAGGYKDQGPQIDVWAMGIIAYECLSGAPPFSGASPAHVMLKIMTETPPSLDTIEPSVPASIAGVLVRALARAPAERHAGMAALRDALRHAAQREGIVLPDEGRPSTTRVFSISPSSQDLPLAAEDDASTNEAHPTGSEGVATMAARLRRDRAERVRADAATQVAPLHRAQESIEVSVEAPVTSSSRRLAVIAGILFTLVLGAGIGLALFGGSAAPPETLAPTSPSATPIATAIEPSPPATTVTPPPTADFAPPETAAIAPAETTSPAPAAGGRPRGPRGGREPSVTSTSMSTVAHDPPETTMAPTMEPGTRMGGLPSVVGWED